MKSKKINTLVINPGLVYELFCQSQDYLHDHELNTIDLDSFSLTDIDSYNLLIFDNVNNDEIVRLKNELVEKRVRKNNKELKSLNYYENYFKKLPVLNSDSLSTEVSNYFLGAKINNKLRNIIFLKRVFDTLVTFLLLPVLVLLLVIGIVIVFVSSNGPIFFKQQRVGINEKPFVIYKLRTMVFRSEGHDSHTTHNDARIFPLGRMLRLTKIDEIPQFLNILKGDMSLIGPRPEKTEIVNDFLIKSPLYKHRHLIRPGITGWAQVNKPIATPLQNLEKLEFDLYYIKNVNFYLDLVIILKTIKVVFGQKSL
jgi:lipopolysaccharide/colanic/teichoic acid biosynthesis glycosyltransferase